MIGVVRVNGARGAGIDVGAKEGIRTMVWRITKEIGGWRTEREEREDGEESERITWEVGERSCVIWVRCVGVGKKELTG